jgi:SAM-dependent methyltransferase
MDYKCLNVGSRSNSIELPHLLIDNMDIISLDVDPETEPDICADLCSLPEKELLPFEEGGLRTKGMFDAVYASHVLEHFPPNKTMAALRAMAHVLKPSGFAIIRVPSIEMLVQHCQTHGLGFQESLHEFTGIPRGVSGQNVIFGMPLEGEWMAHKRHFTGLELVQELHACGFSEVHGGFFPHAIEIMVIAHGPEIDPKLHKLILEDRNLVYMDRSKIGDPAEEARNILTYGKE